ncbi:MAG: hypothetical protein ACUVTZ_05875 [Armatimonadota bacterium]
MLRRRLCLISFLLVALLGAHPKGLGDKPQLYQTYKDDGIVVLGLTKRANRQSAVEIVRKKAATLPALLDAAPVVGAYSADTFSRSFLIR